MLLKTNLTKTPTQMFSKNLVRIKYIQRIQLDIENSEANKKLLKIDFLNKMYIFQLVAFWQVFIEDLAKSGIWLENIHNDKLKQMNLKKEKLDAQLKKFNTPSRKNIDKLFKDVFEIPKLSNSWESDNLKRSRATSSLSILLKSRHEIAHTGNTKTQWSYEKNFQMMRTLLCIAELTENAFNKLEK